MSREETWKKARARVRRFARAKNPVTLTQLQNPDDAEQEEETLSRDAGTLVAIDSPDDVYVHQPEALGIKQVKNKYRM